MVLWAAGAFAREGTEWTTIYWYNANSQDKPRVLLIGDSIVKGYEATVRDELAGSAYVAYYATSKSLTDPSYLKELSVILEAYDYKVIQFNNGLHSLHDDPAEWEKGLRAAVALLKEKGRGAKIVWASSTPLTDPTLSEKAQVLNEIAARVMKENGIAVDDLFALMNPLDRSVYWTDTYHYTPAGVRMEGKQVAATVLVMLGVKTASPDEAVASLKAASSDTGPDGKIVTVSPGLTLAGVLRNSNFEHGAEAWAVYPTDKEKGFCEFVPEGPSPGQTAVKVTVKSGLLQFYQNKPQFTPNTTYLLKYWARASGSVPIATYVRTTAPPYQFYGEQTPVEISSGWHEYTVPITFPAEYIPDACNLFFEFPKVGVCWVADVRVEKK